MQEDEADAPLVLPPSDSDKAALKRLQEAVTGHATALGLPDGVLASRKHLEAWIEGGQWPAALGQWRRQELEQRLLPLIEGTGSG